MLSRGNNPAPAPPGAYARATRASSPLARPEARVPREPGARHRATRVETPRRTPRAAKHTWRPSALSTCHGHTGAPNSHGSPTAGRLLPRVDGTRPTTQPPVQDDTPSRVPLEPRVLAAIAPPTAFPPCPPATTPTTGAPRSPGLLLNRQRKKHIYTGPYFKLLRRGSLLPRRVKTTHSIVIGAVTTPRRPNYKIQALG